MLGGLKFFGGEKLQHDNLLQMTPALSVRCKCNISIIKNDLRCSDIGTRREYQIMHLENLFCQLWWRDDDRANRSQLQFHDVAILLRQLVESSMGQPAEKQKASEHWPDGERPRCSLQLCSPVQPLLDDIVKKNHNSYCGSNYLQFRWCDHELSPLPNNYIRHSLRQMNISCNLISYVFSEFALSIPTLRVELLDKRQTQTSAKCNLDFSLQIRHVMALLWQVQINDSLIGNYTVVCAVEHITYCGSSYRVCPPIALPEWLLYI